MNLQRQKRKFLNIRRPAFWVNCEEGNSNESRQQFSSFLDQKMKKDVEQYCSELANASESLLQKNKNLKFCVRVLFEENEIQIQEQKSQKSRSRSRSRSHDRVLVRHRQRNPSSRSKSPPTDGNQLESRERVQKPQIKYASTNEELDQSIFDDSIRKKYKFLLQSEPEISRFEEEDEEQEEEEEEENKIEKKNQQVEKEKAYFINKRVVKKFSKKQKQKQKWLTSAGQPSRPRNFVPKN